MANYVQFDVRFVDADTGLGVQADSDLYVEVYQIGASSPTATRVRGTDQNSAVVEVNDATGYYYMTYVDVESYVQGRLTAKWYGKQSGIQIDPYPTVLTAEYPSALLLNGASVKSYVLGMLGFPTVSVELTDGQIAMCVTQALSLYNRWCTRERKGIVVLESGKYAYPLPTVSSRGVSNVTFVRKDQLNLTSFPFFGREFPIWPNIDFDAFVLGQAHWETVRRVAGVEPEFQYRVENGTLYIALGGPSGSQDPSLYDVEYTYFQDLSIDQIPLSHHAWFRQYCLAVAKEILGRTRGKWSGTVPSPGGTLTLDSASLLQEAKDERMALEEDIRLFAPTVPMIRG